MKKESIIKGIKIIFSYLKEYKKDLIILTVLSVISALSNGIVPYLTGRLFDAILNPSKIFVFSKLEMPLWLFLIIIWGIIRFIADIIDWRSSVKNERLSNIIHADYIVKGFSTLLELPTSFHKNYKMGEITDKIHQAAIWLTQIAGSVIIELTPQFLSIFVGLFVVFSIKPLLAFIILLGVLSYLAVLIRILRPAAELQRKGHQAYSKAFGDAYDAVFNVSTIKQAGGEKDEWRKLYKNLHLKAVKIWNKITAVWQGVSFYQRFIVMLTQLVIFILSIFFIKKGEMTIGELIMFNGYAALFFGPFVRLGFNWQTIQNGLIAVERAEKILTSPKEIYLPENAIILSDIKGEIEFDKVNFTYHKKQKNVLDEINFKINPGEVVALVGESGVGKSTLIDLISAYYFPQKGKVLIDGHNVKNLDLKFLRSKIAVVSQEVVLFNDTIKTNIKYGNLGASDKKVKEAAFQAYCSEFIEKFPKKWNQIVGERGIKLSVGQKQRVAIARAILRDPKILILDEPTSALDAKSEKFIQESLEKLMKERTTIIIAHRLSTVRKADKIFIIDKGKIVEQGKHEELIKIPNGIYRHLYELQIGLK